MPDSLFEVGDIVRSLDRPEWGEGQVQSVIGAKITITFRHAGKIVLSGAMSRLQIVERDV